MDADLAQMDVLGLYYDDNHLSLVNTVKAYLKEFGIGESQIAFSYKDLNSGRTAAMNDHQPMIAGSTYKLPLNMLVVDKANYPRQSVLTLQKLIMNMIRNIMPMLLSSMVPCLFRICKILRNHASLCSSRTIGWHE